jgi:hypothetical protein
MRLEELGDAIGKVADGSQAHLGNESHAFGGRVPLSIGSAGGKCAHSIGNQLSHVLAAFNHLEGFNEAWGRSPPILLHFVAEEPTAIGNDKERRCVDHDACCYEGGARSPGGRGKTRATSRGCIGLEWHTVAPIGGHHTGTRISDFRRPSHSRLAIQNYFSTHVLTL